MIDPMPSCGVASGRQSSRNQIPMEKPIDNGAAQFAADEIQRLEDRIKRLEAIIAKQPQEADRIDVGEKALAATTSGPIRNTGLGHRLMV